jgi:hypothetical protein
LGYPSEKDFRNMVSSNMITNCPVTPTDISAANKIVGPNVALIKGKTVRITQEPVLTSYVKIPQDVMLIVGCTSKDGRPAKSARRSDRDDEDMTHAYL